MMKDKKANTSLPELALGQFHRSISTWAFGGKEAISTPFESVVGCLWCGAFGPFLSGEMAPSSYASELELASRCVSVQVWVLDCAISSYGRHEFAIKCEQAFE
jgi:hypothetical protein